MFVFENLCIYILHISDSIVPVYYYPSRLFYCQSYLLSQIKGENPFKNSYMLQVHIDCDENEKKGKLLQWKKL